MQSSILGLLLLSLSSIAYGAELVLELEPALDWNEFYNHKETVPLRVVAPASTEDSCYCLLGLNDCSCSDSLIARECTAKVSLDLRLYDRLTFAFKMPAGKELKISETGGPDLWMTSVTVQLVAECAGTTGASFQEIGGVTMGPPITPSLSGGDISDFESRYSYRLSNVEIGNPVDNYFGLSNNTCWVRSTLTFGDTSTDENFAASLSEVTWSVDYDPSVVPDGSLTYTYGTGVLLKALGSRVPTKDFVIGTEVSSSEVRVVDATVGQTTAAPVATTTSSPTANPTNVEATAQPMSSSITLKTLSWSVAVCSAAFSMIEWF
jgi:hypothetical protein